MGLSFNPGNAARTVAMGLMGRVQGEQIRRQNERADLMDKLYQIRVDEASKPKWSLQRTATGLRPVGIYPDGRVEYGDIVPGSQDPTKGKSYFTDAEGGRWQQDDATNTIKPVKIEGDKKLPRKRIAPAYITDENGIKYQMIPAGGSYDDGTPKMRKGPVMHTPAPSVSETEDIVGETVVSKGRTEKSPGFEKTSNWKAPPSSIVQRLGKNGVPGITTSSTTEGATTISTETANELPVLETGAEKRAREAAERSVQKHEKDMKPDEMSENQLLTKFNQLSGSLAKREDAVQEKGVFWDGPKPDPVVTAGYIADLTEIIELGKRLNDKGYKFPLEKYEALKAEAEGRNAVEESMGRIDDIIGAGWDDEEPEMIAERERGSRFEPASPGEPENQGIAGPMELAKLPKEQQERIYVSIAKDVLANGRETVDQAQALDFFGAAQGEGSLVNIQELIAKGLITQEEFDALGQIPNSTSTK